jgi:hypothetical protein
MARIAVDVRVGPEGKRAFRPWWPEGPISQRYSTFLTSDPHIAEVISRPKIVATGPGRLVYPVCHDRLEYREDS